MVKLRDPPRHKEAARHSSIAQSYKSSRQLLCPQCAQHDEKPPFLKCSPTNAASPYDSQQSVSLESGQDNVKHGEEKPPEIESSAYGRIDSAAGDSPTVRS